MIRAALAFTLLVLLGSAILAQQVPRRGELDIRYQLVLEERGPYLLIDLHNRGARMLDIELPAGLPLLGQREPCQPVVLARPIRGRMSSGQKVRVKVEALSLSLSPHHPGPYELPPAPPQEDRFVRIARAVHTIWELSQAKQLKGTALKLSRLAAYALGEEVPLEQVRSMATPAEWNQLQQILSR